MEYDLNMSRDFFDHIPIATLVARLNKGDMSAFEEIYARLHPKVYSYCQGFTKSSLASEEILQDVFVKLWQKRDQIDPEKSIQAFVYKLTRDLTFDYLKKVARDEKLRTEMLSRFVVSTENTESQIIFDDYALIAKRAISSLPPQRQRIYKLRQEEGLSYKKIAEELDISPNTVKVQLVKASKSIKSYLYTHADLTFPALVAAAYLLD